MLDNDADLATMTVDAIVADTSAIYTRLFNEDHTDDERLVMLGRLHSAIGVLAARVPKEPSVPTHIEVAAEVRYWEDAAVNGVDDEDGSRIPGRKGDLWTARIHLDEGRIEDWPEGLTARIHYKVCDAGEYWLTDASGERLLKWAGHYVPDAFLCHGDDGYGDYIILTVNERGVIEKYRRPEVKDDQWGSV